MASSQTFETHEAVKREEHAYSWQQHYASDLCHYLPNCERALRDDLTKSYVFGGDEEEFQEFVKRRDF